MTHAHESATFPEIIGTGFITWACISTSASKRIGAIPGITTVQADAVLNAADIQDVTPPTTTLSVQGGRGPLGYFVGPVTVTIAASDAGTGVELIQYSVDEGQTWVTYSGPLSLIAEHVPAVLARSMDRAGNQETPEATARLQPFRLLVPYVRR